MSLAPVLKSEFLRRCGANDRNIHNWVKQGKLVRVKRGLFVTSDSPVDELFCLLYESSKAVVSHESALYIHGLSDRVPEEFCFTFRSTDSPSAFLRKKIKVYYVKPDLFELGLTEGQTVFGNPVRLYDRERTVCDILRSRRRVLRDTLLYALREYCWDPSHNFPKLREYAKRLRVESVLERYLEVLL